MILRYNYIYKDSKTLSELNLKDLSIWRVRASPLFQKRTLENVMRAVVGTPN